MVFPRVGDAGYCAPVQGGGRSSYLGATGTPAIVFLGKVAVGDNVPGQGGGRRSCSIAAGTPGIVLFRDWEAVSRIPSQR